jgi:predicted AlkP superfamily pyrophosphatase or phosphodiesterase
MLLFEAPLRPQRSLILGILLAWVAGAQGASETLRPGLVVVIVIDQFPESLLTRLSDRLGPSGFRKLMEEGAWFTEASYEHAATLTGPGHATIATGSLPAGHGIVGNDWYDRARDRAVYCVEDPSSHWVGGKEKEGDGTSPRNLTTTTFADEWLLATRREARAVSISLKDRGSILLGGRLPKAYWYDEKTGFFVSSTYYFPEGRLPAWVESFNACKRADGCFGATWSLLLSPASYRSAPDDRPYEIDLKGLGRTFPHVLGRGLPGPGPDFYKLLVNVPQGNDLIFDLARAAVEGEQLGQRGTTDLLLLSLTANDYCGHVFGPESLEYEDIALRTDRQLESFRRDLERLVGSARIWTVLTSDHGATPSPEYLAEAGFPVGRIDPEALAKAADEALDATYGPEDWAAKFLNPGLFLRAEPIRRRQVPLADAERTAARAVLQVPGVAAAFPRAEIAAGALPQTALGRSVSATFHAERGPDVYIIQEPYWYLYKDMKKYEGMHGSPYACDSHVPLVFHGPGIVRGRYARRVSPAAVAPTLCHLLGINPPASSESEALEEVIKTGVSGSPAATTAAAPVSLARNRLELYLFPTLPPLLGPDGAPPRVPITLDADGKSRLSASGWSSPVEGGFSGLSLARGASPGAPAELWTITDRGPNLVIDKRRDGKGELFGKDSKLFPASSYHQAILRLRLLPDRTAEIVERVALKRAGIPIVGLPSSDGRRPSAETAYADPADRSPASIIPPSPAGYDFEGIHVDEPAGGEARTFWTCEEYGPSLQVFDAQGNLIRELAPGAAPSGAGTADDPAIAPIPAVFRHRRANRGFEGLTGTSKHVFAMAQSPFDSEGGVSKEPGHANPQTRLQRIMRLDKRTFEVAQFAYDHIADPESFGATHADVKIGDLTAVNDSGTEFLVLEYASERYAHVYRVRITSETTVLDEKAGVAYEAGKTSYRPVEKTLLVDMTEELRILPVPSKPEGLLLLDPETLLILFDNDYGLGSDDADIFALPDLKKRALLLRVGLEAVVR